MINKLYGDGIHDDTLALQEMIDTTAGGVTLPFPEKCYLISRPLELPSNFKLTLPRYAEIKLMTGSDCVMLKNKTVDGCYENTDQELFGILNSCSPDHLSINIEVEGGIWNFNNKEQTPNPIVTGCLEPKNYGGLGFIFYNVKNLTISNMTLKDPVTFAVTLDTVSYFTVKDIIFDFNYGNPLATNMDGIHLDGNCHFGHIQNLKGACYDDLVALNADEGTRGPITNITIDGIYSEDCHSAVRLLSANYPVKNSHITNVYGTYFQYCIGVTRFYETKDKGFYDGITLDHIYASKAERLPVYNKRPEDYVYPLIYVADKLYVKSLQICDLHRRETLIPVETSHLAENTVVETLVLNNISSENHTAFDRVPLVQNLAEIKHLHMDALYEDGEAFDWETMSRVTVSANENGDGR